MAQTDRSEKVVELYLSLSLCTGEVGHSIAFCVTRHESNASCEEIQAVPPVVEASLCGRQKEVVSWLPLVCMHDHHFQIRPSDVNCRTTW